MIDPGKLYDWLNKRDIEIIRWEDGTSRWVPPEEFGELFRAYVEELTDR